jgi:UDP-glucuronate decarboxylase
MNSQNNFVGPVNLGNPVEFSIVELAEKILSLVKSKSKLIYKPLPSDDPKQRQPDISLARKKLDWEPNVDLEIGLRKTIDYFSQIKLD